MRRIGVQHVRQWYDRNTAPAPGPLTSRQQLVRKVVRRVHWARTEGFGRIVEEDRLDPRPRVRAAWRKHRWRAAHDARPGAAVPVYVVGLQRSGTNMLMRGLDEAPETEVRNENDSALFDRFRIRSTDTLRRTVLASRQQVVFVKPICDSHLLDTYLDLDGLAPGRGLWVYRDVDARARSEVSKFGPANLWALRDISAGLGDQRWQGERLPPAALDLIRSFDLETMTEHTAAALFWVVRNGLFFDLGFDARDDVQLVSYDAFAADPPAEMRRLCEFVGLPYRSELDEHVDRRVSHGSGRLDLEPRVRELAEAMGARLDAHRLARAGGAPPSGTSQPAGAPAPPTPRAARRRRGRERMTVSPWRRTALPAVLAALTLSLALAACSPSEPTEIPVTQPPSTSGSSGGTGGTGTTGGSTGGPVLPAGDVGPIGAKLDWSRVDLVKPYLAGLGATPTFYEMVWCEVEPSQGQRDWSTVDGIAQKAAALHVSLMIKIRVGACWATGDQQPQKVRGAKGKTESFLPADLDTYRNFVTDTVKRYSAKGVHVYAVENEINSASFWGGSVADYEKLVRVAAPAIRAADPKAVVTDMGISSTAYGVGIAQRLLDAGKDAEAVTAWNTYYERRIGTRGDQLRKVDDVAGLREQLGEDQPRRNAEYLALATKLATDKTVDVRQVHFYESYRAAPLLTDYLRATTPAGTPIEAWEVGQFLTTGSLTDAQRTDEVVKSVALLLAGGIRMVLWLPLVVNPDGRNSDEPRYGLVNVDGTARLTGTAFAAMAKAAAGASVRAVATPKVTGVLFSGSTTSSAFVWATSSEVTLPAGAGKVLAPVSGAAAGDAVSTSPREITSTGTATDLLEALS